MWENTRVSLFLSCSLKLKVPWIIPNNAELNLICDDTFQIYCNYQDSESETGNHFNLLGTISKPLFKACGSGLV